jgi:hypothetical protein
MQNKANSRRARHPIIPLFHHSSIPVFQPRPFVRNKANLARDGFRLDVATRRSYDAQTLQSARIVEEQ